MNIIYEKTALGAFYKLVQEGQDKIGVSLEQDLEAFLVFALLRNMDQIYLKDVNFALEILDAIQTTHINQLEVILDKSLIIGGLYPKRVSKLGVSPNYIYGVGMMACDHLVAYYKKIRSGYADIYNKIKRRFEILIVLLQSLRRNFQFGK